MAGIYRTAGLGSGLATLSANVTVAVGIITLTYSSTVACAILNTLKRYQDTNRSGEADGV